MKKVKLLLLSAILATLTLGLSSCEDEYYDSVVGTWEMIADEHGPVPDNYIDKYAFYSDGSGVYGCFDDYGYWVGNTPFVWWYSGNNKIVIDFGRSEVFTYYYDFYGSHLVLSGDYNFRTYWEYRQVSH